VAVAARKRLASREVDVGRRLVARRTEYQISRALGIAESTVHSHVLHLETKLEADGHGGAVEKFQLIHNEWRNAPIPEPPPPGCPWGVH
jgi:DNA-binding CsgD family transcriptional regulator